MISNEELDILIDHFKNYNLAYQDVVLCLEELRELRKSRQFPVMKNKIVINTQPVDEDRIASILREILA